MIYCRFRGGRYQIHHDVLRRGKCPACGAVRTLTARSGYYTYPQHKEVQISTLHHYLELDGDVFSYHGGLDVIPEEKPRGTANLDKGMRCLIARMGGKAAHAAGTAHKWTSEEAREAGRKGGHRKRKQSESENVLPKLRG